MANRLGPVVGKLILLAGSAVVSTLSAQAGSSPQTSIKTLRMEWNTAFATRDTARMGQLIADSAVFLSDRMELRGRERVTQVFGGLFQSKPDIQLVFTPETILPRPIGPSDMVASESGRWDESWSQADGTVVLGGTYYDVWRREPEGWRIAVHSFATTSCSGTSAYCGSRQ